MGTKIWLRCVIILLLIAGICRASDVNVADGNIINVEDIDANGVVTAGTFADGTSTLTGGKWSDDTWPDDSYISYTATLNISAKDSLLFKAVNAAIIKPDDDPNDYFQFNTVSDVPTLTTVGSCDLNITSSSGIVKNIADLFYVEGKTSATDTHASIWPKDKDGTDDVGYVIYGVGEPGDTGIEDCIFEWNAAEDRYQIYTLGDAPYSFPQALAFFVYPNTDQLVLDTSGDVSMSGDLAVTGDLIVDGTNAGVTAHTDLLTLANSLLTVDGNLASGATADYATSLFPNRTGDGTSLTYGSGIGAKLFENADSANENPALAIYGYGSGAQKYAAIYVDEYARLIFGGTAPAVGTVFDGTLVANTALLIDGSVAGFLHKNTASSNAPVGHITFGATHEAGAAGNKPVWVMVDYDQYNLDFDVPDTEYPQLWLHDGSTTAANVLKLYHDTSDGVITSGLGDVKIDDSLNVTGNTTLGDASTDTITHTGRMMVRDVNDNAMDATAGNQKEIVFNLDDSKFYGCTVTGDPATWSALN